MEAIYRRTQVGRVAAVVLAVAAAGTVWWSFRTLHPAGISVALLVAGLLVQFSTLTVTVRDHSLQVSFGPGVIRRHIPLERIRDVRTVRTPWYYGWGIRLTPSGWLWRVSGLSGVEIRLEDGHRFRIGSDEPDKLADVLRRQVRAV
ncbi:MAG TPA: hypothetical protein VFO19_23570 [Vicinamibacterales bacterium]|nr:hypothetical protein [Vicinamibacterales bacterium]